MFRLFCNDTSTQQYRDTINVLKHYFFNVFDYGSLNTFIAACTLSYYENFFVGKY